MVKITSALAKKAQASALDFHANKYLGTGMWGKCLYTLELPKKCTQKMHVKARVYLGKAVYAKL